MLSLLFVCPTSHPIPFHPIPSHTLSYPTQTPNPKQTNKQTNPQSCYIALKDSKKIAITNPPSLSAQCITGSPHPARLPAQLLRRAHEPAHLRLHPAGIRLREQGEPDRGHQGGHRGRQEESGEGGVCGVERGWVSGAVWGRRARG